MSYWPAFDCPSWNALAKNESYGSVRNSTVVPVASWNIGRIVDLNGARAPSSKAPITSLPPAFVAPAVAPAAVGPRVGAAEDPPAPQAASTALVAATPPMATPRRSTSRRVKWRDRTSSSLTGSLLLWRWSAFTDSMDHGPAAWVEKARIRRIDAHPDGRAQRCRPASVGPDRDTCLADKHLHIRLVAERLNDVDRPRQRRRFVGRREG